MVDEQIAGRGIRDARILRAMRQVPRHLFIGEEQRHRSYEDHALPIGEGQTISQPYMVAMMTEALSLEAGAKVLEVGTGSGYQSAVLSEMGARVYSVERISSLSHRAEEILRELGYRVNLRVADGTLGWPEEAPFDGILVTAGSPEVPDGLVQQLRMGGRIVIPVGDRYSQNIICGVRTPEGLTSQSLLPCVFVPLLGQFGWKSDNAGL